MDRWLLPTLVAGIAAIAVVVVGMTITGGGAWYHGLIQPRWAPPDALHGVGWTIVYALAALAGINAWIAAPYRGEREWLAGLYALSGFLAIAWSLLFFRMHRPDWAAIEAIALWLSVGALIVFVWRRSMTAAVLLVPYLLWVTFAGYWTMTIVRLNGPLP